MTVAARGWGLRASDSWGGADGSRERKTLQTLCKTQMTGRGWISITGIVAEGHARFIS